jgi:hypothetical protein
MGRVVESYFHTLFTTSNLQNMEAIFAAVERRVNPDINQQLCMPFTGTEVYQAMSQMHLSKSPSPDGMSCSFFQKF